MKGANSTFRPAAGTIVLASLPHEDDENGYRYFETKILWSDCVFVAVQRGDNWPDVFKWDHIICKPVVEKFDISDVTSTDNSKSFHDELTSVINRYSKENESDTPDYILALYLMACLDAFSFSVILRDRWYGFKTLTRDHSMRCEGSGL